MENVQFNKKEIISKGLSPSIKWDEKNHGSVADPFQTLTTQETSYENACEGSTPADLRKPFLELRIGMLHMAVAVDHKVKVPNFELPRFIMQDVAQSEAIMFDVLTMHAHTAEPDAGTGDETDEIYKNLNGDGKPKPLLVVRWAYNTAANKKAAMDSFNASSKLHPKINGFKKLPDLDVNQIRFMKKFLEINTKSLDKDFVDGHNKVYGPLPKGWNFSCIYPITTDILKKTSIETCKVCDAQPKKLKKCSRCKLVYYCSALG